MASGSGAHGLNTIATEIIIMMPPPFASHLQNERIMHRKDLGFHYCATINDIASLPGLNLNMVLTKTLKSIYFDDI